MKYETLAELVYVKNWDEWVEGINNNEGEQKTAFLKERSEAAKMLETNNLNDIRVLMYVAFKAGIEKGLVVAQEL